MTTKQTRLTPTPSPDTVIAQRTVPKGDLLAGLGVCDELATVARDEHLKCPRLTYIEGATETIYYLTSDLEVA